MLSILLVSLILFSRRDNSFVCGAVLGGIVFGITLAYKIYAMKNRTLRILLIILIYSVLLFFIILFLLTFNFSGEQNYKRDKFAGDISFLIALVTFLMTFTVRLFLSYKQRNSKK